jgi:hypothetical protein
MMAVIVAILWLQDAIWKTFQSRIETRVLHLENLLRATPVSHQEQLAFQLHSQFQEQRKQGGMVAQYLSSAVRPTVAFPYAALLGLLALSMLR